MSAISAQNGDTISVHYVGKFPGGKVFDTSMKAEAIMKVAECDIGDRV